jgi:hypothetical protein
MEKRWLWTILGSLALGAVLVVVLIVALLSVPSVPTGPVASPTPAGASPSASTTPAPSATAPPVTPVRAEATCENIMHPEFSTEWLPARVEEPEPLFADGIQCWWAADPTVGTDNVLLYGWAPATEDEWNALVAERMAETDAAWFTEEDERGVYLTHKTDYWVQDAEGYGTTYLFTGEAILFAQTKEETADVVGPPSA